MGSTPRMCADDDTSPVKCDNCGWIGPANKTEDISDMFSRVEPGGELPVGECPECGCLAYLKG